MNTIERPSAETIKAYEQTDYFADDQPPVRLRVHDTDAQHQAWLARHQATSASILTAWNPFGQALTTEDNEARQARLQAAIEATGLPWLTARGEDPEGSWQPEPGFCVFNVPDGLLKRWLVDFEQNAAVRLERGQGCQLVWHPVIDTLFAQPQGSP